MSLYLDIKYLKIMNLDRFGSKNMTTFGFRCPICGDSKKNKRKARGYAEKHRTKDNLFVYCHNCNYAGFFPQFLKDANPDLFKQYQRESIQEKFRDKEISKENEVVLPEEKQIVKTKFITFLGDPYEIQRCSDLREVETNTAAYVLTYLVKRHIHEKYFNKIYYTQNFRKWILKFYDPNKYKTISAADERIVFPILNTQGELIGIQGRGINLLESDTTRYLSVRLVETEQMCFGMDRIDFLKEVYVVEGIFDSLMLENSIAMLKSNINMDFIKEKFYSKQVVFIFDNEVRNANIVSHMKSIADNIDYGLFIWPKNYPYKDLNEAASKTIMSQNEIHDFVKKGTIYGKLKKNLAVANWIK